MHIKCVKPVFIFSLLITIIPLFLACFEKERILKNDSIYDYIQDPIVLLNDSSFRGVKLQTAMDSLSIDSCRMFYIHEPPCSYQGISFHVNDSIRIEFYTQMTKQNRQSDSCTWDYKLVLNEEIVSTIVFYKGLQTRRFEKYRDVFLKLINKKVHN